MKMTKRDMPETMYRASRCCRVLGNPTAYLIVRALDAGRKTPSQLSQELQIPLPTVSVTLRHLREIDMVRYIAAGSSKEYWVKDRMAMRVLDLLERLVDKMRSKQV